MERMEEGKMVNVIIVIMHISVDVVFFLFCFFIIIQADEYGYKTFIVEPWQDTPWKHNVTQCQA